jgi:hypothetical protein
MKTAIFCPDTNRPQSGVPLSLGLLSSNPINVRLLLLLILINLILQMNMRSIGLPYESVHPVQNRTAKSVQRIIYLHLLFGKITDKFGFRNTTF